MRYVMHLMYDGHSVNGFAKQPHKNTIEDVVNETLSMILNSEINIIGSARTDSKVHALDQVIMFDYDKELDINDFKYKFNRVVKSYIYCFDVYIKDDLFHVRHDMKSKTYRYYIMKTYNPFKRTTAYYHPKEINVNKITKELKKIEGTFNFKSFCASKSSVKEYERTINFTNVFEEDDMIIIEINASGFLYNMMRIIVGTLIDISDNKIDKTLLEIVESEDRKLAGKTAPPQGLCLYKSIY